jgi:DNA helicase-2/ATP-dependent DNA helicase PcrA
VTATSGPASTANVRASLLDDLDDEKLPAVTSGKRRLLLIAGAGSGKTEVVARRIAWWVATGVPKESIVAFTFEERAAEEMKFRVRKYVEAITSPGEDTTLGGMYVGTIHAYCLKILRELAPAEYHNYDVIDEVARAALVQLGYYDLLGLPAFQAALSEQSTDTLSAAETMERFLLAYDLLNEHGELAVRLPTTPTPQDLGRAERDWCKEASLGVDVGASLEAQAFASSAARYYAYLRCRRFLDFSTSQSEAVHMLKKNDDLLDKLRARVTHLVVDEVQDVNPVQYQLIRTIVGSDGHLTAVGDHRQAIFGWRGGRIELMAELAKELQGSADGQVLELSRNFRSTPRIIDLSNAWNQSIGTPAGLTSPAMRHGRMTRSDYEPADVGAIRFPTREAEAEWIASTVGWLVRQADHLGATHDTTEGTRGLTLSDIAILLRTSRDARAYMSALRAKGIPSVVRAGPDLFSQPEVLLMVGSLGLSAGMDTFLGGHQATSLPQRITEVLGCAPIPEVVIRAAGRTLRAEGVPMDPRAEERLILASRLVHRRIVERERIPRNECSPLVNSELRAFLETGPEPLRRVFPQSVFNHLLAEVGVARWDGEDWRLMTAMFHMGQLSSLITGIETPGWTSPSAYSYQVRALLTWASKHARVSEAPLLVTPDAVQIATIHAVKGRQFAAVFVADVASWRFPSSQAKKPPSLPFDGPILSRIKTADLADNGNLDGERRLMYVALTRAERYLWVTSSKPSKFYRAKGGKEARGVAELISTVGGYGDVAPDRVPAKINYLPSRASVESRLVTSFSDMRYFLECPHDFYLRKVLGFAPTIDQAFGYGRGIHNLLRQVHSDPQAWAAIAGDRAELLSRLDGLIRGGQFQLKHTVGEPAERMKRRAREVVADYVQEHVGELQRMQFEPERSFETLIEEEQLLISGAIDVIRLDDPPRVTIIDFKSGQPDSDARMSLDEDEMRLQVMIYGLAARHELEYEPDRGLVRYLGSRGGQPSELEIDMTEESLLGARVRIAEAAGGIRDRRFRSGPARTSKDDDSAARCDECDFVRICGLAAPRAARNALAGPTSRIGPRSPAPT